MCSRRCEMPVIPALSFLEPTLYQTMNETTGAVCTSWISTLSPFESVVSCTGGWTVAATALPLMDGFLGLDVEPASAGGVKAAPRSRATRSVPRTASLLARGPFIRRLAGPELHVSDPVSLGVPLRVANGDRGRFDPDRLARARRDREGERAGSRVDVQDPLRTGETEPLEGRREEALGLIGIRLEEGARRDLEGEAAERLQDRRASGEHMLLVPDRDLRLPARQVEKDARDRGKRALKLSRHPLERRGGLGRDQVDHDLPGPDALAHHQEPEQPLVAPGIVGLQLL